MSATARSLSIYRPVTDEASQFVIAELQTEIGDECPEFQPTPANELRLPFFDIDDLNPNHANYILSHAPYDANETLDMTIASAECQRKVRNSGELGIVGIALTLEPVPKFNKQSKRFAQSFKKINPEADELQGIYNPGITFGTLPGELATASLLAIAKKRAGLPLSFGAMKSSRGRLVIDVASRTHSGAGLPNAVTTYKPGAFPGVMKPRNQPQR